MELLDLDNDMLQIIVRHCQVRKYWPSPKDCVGELFPIALSCKALRAAQQIVHPEKLRTSMQPMLRTLSLAEWSEAIGAPWQWSVCRSACASAAAAGNLELLKSCRSRGFPWGSSASGSAYESTAGQAAERGQVEILRWVHEQGAPFDELDDWGGIFALACMGGHLPALQFLLAKGHYDPTNDEYCGAATHSVETLGWTMGKCVL